MIAIDNLNKIFKVHYKRPGLKGSLESLFKRKWIYKKALNDISLTIKQGEKVGLIGHNGAGKTTLVKILSGIIYPTSGEVNILGYRPWERNNNFRKQISLIMGQKASLWWDLPAGDCFLLLKEIYQINNKSYQQMLDQLLTVLEAKDQLKTPIRKLSLGERMKMELIEALLHRPKIIFLDEPTIGLDLTAQKNIRSFIDTYHKEHNCTIILTSHYMQDIEEICDRTLMVRNGNIIYDGKLKNIHQSDHQFKIIDINYQNQDELNLIQNTVLNNFGIIIDQNNYKIKIQVSKSNLKLLTRKLLQNCTFKDFNIYEIEKTNHIANIMKNGIQHHYSSENQISN